LACTSSARRSVLSKTNFTKTGTTYNTNAIAFYKKFGFAENRVVHDDIAKLPNGKEIPEVEMIRRPQVTGTGTSG
jgi:hypothetical protein